VQGYPAKYPTIYPSKTVTTPEWEQAISNCLCECFWSLFLILTVHGRGYFNRDQFGVVVVATDMEQFCPHGTTVIDLCRMDTDQSFRWKATLKDGACLCQCPKEATSFEGLWRLLLQRRWTEWFSAHHYLLSNYFETSNLTLLAVCKRIHPSR
jgi:hypothetical protein